MKVESLPGKTRVHKSATPGAKHGPERIMQMAWSYAPTLILHAALEFRLFDTLENGPKPAQEVAALAGASERGVRAILNALVGLEFLKREGANYALVPESAEFLVSSRPNYRGMLFHHVGHQLLPRWMKLPEAVRTGRPVYAVNQEKSGSAFFAEFVEALFPMNYPAARALAEHLEMGKAGPCSVLDVAAGSGVWGFVLAEANPALRVHAVDWPDVLPVTRKVAQQHGLADRLTTSGGDLLKADLGTGHRVATLGHILHSEGIERSKALLRRVYEALAPGGTIAIAEWIPNEERTGPPGALIFAINMLVHTDQGDTYTFGEMSEWLTRAGFKYPRLLEVPAPCPLVLATKG